MFVYLTPTPPPLHPGVAQVTRLAAQIQARAYGAYTVATQSEPVWGVVERAAPFEGSALAEYIYDDVPLIPVTNTPPQVTAPAPCYAAWRLCGLCVHSCEGQGACLCIQGAGCGCSGWLAEH